MDLGEDESIVIALAEADRGTFEARAAARDGWRRPPGPTVPLTELVQPLRQVIEAASATAARRRRQRR